MLIEAQQVLMAAIRKLLECWDRLLPDERSAQANALQSRAEELNREFERKMTLMLTSGLEHSSEALESFKLTTKAKVELEGASHQLEERQNGKLAMWYSTHAVWQELRRRRQQRGIPGRVLGGAPK